MAGHSKWANIKHRKGAQDAKRGKIFQKLSKEISVAATRGADINSNPALRLAVSKARSASMPKSNIEKAIAKGSGSGKDAVQYTELTYSGTVSKGVQILVVCLTDNLNRLTANIGSMFRRANGALGKQNSIPYVFERKGLIEIDSSLITEDDITMIALDAGASDIVVEDKYYSITCEPEDFVEVLDKIRSATNFEEFLSAEISYIANSTVDLDEEEAQKVLDFIERLESDDDVQNVYHNLG
ncbi:YebC/PmpR family DNA-binding transcriptional regulator [Mycoplasmopsis agassizii]|uniref:Probable transcriptional regulatory protein CJF60_01085 n=1 Tax=Mycoplasmopsis agassizii TaxID=33922 RepID=A0ABX4H5T5_9BACT|nr:YebC/PmpR family DNA-binding transcriptional regulator [Mycoplasmopsis agassizii]PAF55266.1 YebC/PmpR family DNA-binding transcriptional regulator [Mycoplasmopsis agassizii]SMC15684.1 DNA-binding regulatory protein, YebC/PmpR family [Mycoplasmopsis agassizii]